MIKINHHVVTKRSFVFLLKQFRRANKKEEGGIELSYIAVH